MKYVRPTALFKECLKRKSNGRLLGLDVGDKYVGVAVSDTHYQIASSLSVLVRKKSNIDLMATDFQTLISELSVTGFVVGYGYRFLRNAPALDAMQVKVFIDDLHKTEKLEGVEFTYWDERFSSKTSELLLKPLGLHQVYEKTMMDKLAAVEILQDYLDNADRRRRTLE